jgi:dihydrodipicolinate synthase/N-acetylneuraminate lyase
MSFGELITAMVTPFDEDNKVNLEVASHRGIDNTDR